MGQCTGAMYGNVWQCMGWCMRQSSSRKQGRGRMGSDSSRKWGEEQKGPKASSSAMSDRANVIHEKKYHTDRLDTFSKTGYVVTAKRNKL